MPNMSRGFSFRFLCLPLPVRLDSANTSLQVQGYIFSKSQKRKMISPYIFRCSHRIYFPLETNSRENMKKKNTSFLLFFPHFPNFPLWIMGIPAWGRDGPGGPGPSSPGPDAAAPTSPADLQTNGYFLRIFLRFFAKKNI